MLLGHLAHELRGRAVRDALGVGVVVRVLHLAEVRAVEELLQADDLGALRRGGGDVRDRVGDHRVFVPGPALLHQPGLDDL